MIPLESFPHHLHTLTPANWKSLFSLLPEIEQTTSFGHAAGGETVDGVTTIPYWVPADIVTRTINVLNELQLIPVFDWMQWEEGRNILNTPHYYFMVLPVVDLCRLLTVITRTDRFSEGYLVRCFENGSVLGILRALEKKV